MRDHFREKREKAGSFTHLQLNMHNIASLILL